MLNWTIYSYSIFEVFVWNSPKWEKHRRNKAPRFLYDFKPVLGQISNSWVRNYKLIQPVFDDMVLQPPWSAFPSLSRIHPSSRSSHSSVKPSPFAPTMEAAWVAGFKRVPLRLTRKCWNKPGCSHSCVTLQKKAFRNRFINKGIAAVSRGLRPIIRIKRNAKHGIHRSSYYTSVLFPATSADSGVQIADTPPGRAHAHSTLLYTHTKSTTWTWEGVWNNNYLSRT